jgi:hypothetical protein
MKTITLNKPQIETLMRCLRYGKVAVSEIEHRNGTAKKIERHTKQIQNKLV